MEIKERIFFLLSLSCLALCLSLLYFLSPVLKRRVATWPDYPHPWDFLDSGFYLVLLLVAREILTRGPLPIIADKCISKKAADRQERIARFSLASFKLFYFVFTTVWGYWLLADKSFFPVSLGGKNPDWLGELWKNVPFESVDPNFRNYYMVSMAYHLHSLIYHVLIMPKRNDYAEMLMHHLLALFLIAYSYLLGYVKIGCLVLFVHDLPDVVGYAVKAAVMTPYDVLTLFIYAALLVSWGYTRLYVFPKDIIMATLAKETDQVGEEDYGRYSFFGMLVGLLGLHVYWYYLFLHMGYRFLTKGKVEDIQQKIGAKKKDL